VLTLLALLGGPLLVEGAVRVLVFHPSELAGRLGADLRDPRRFAAPMEDADYWKLQHLLARDDGHIPGSVPHPELGWVRPQLDPDTLRHRHTPDGRHWRQRPILLYGASFAGCKVPKDGCFEGLLAASPLGPHWRLFNYGTSGHGAGQALLLLQRSIDHYTEQRPVVLIGLVIGSDFDRATLPFRGRPKPYYELVDDELVLRPLGTDDIEAYLDRHPIEVRSYAWNLLIHGTDLLPRGLASKLRGLEDSRRRKGQLWRHLVSRFKDELEARELQYAFLLFNREEVVLSDDAMSWRDPFLYQAMEDLEVPYLSAKSIMRRAAERLGADVRDFFQPGNGHPTALGNQVVLEAVMKFCQEPEAALREFGSSP